MSHEYVLARLRGCAANGIGCGSLSTGDCKAIVDHIDDLAKQLEAARTVERKRWERVWKAYGPGAGKGGAA